LKELDLLNFGEVVIRKLSSVLLLLCIIYVSAQDVSYAVDLNNFDERSHVIQFDAYASSREFNIYLPKSYEKDVNKRYPVLYMLEGGRYIRHVTSIVQNLSMRRKIPEIILVVIPAGKTRQLDYTPEYITQRNSEELGRANVFSSFLSKALIPFVDETYRTAGLRILAGHSRSGLFAIDEMIGQRGMFHAYFAFSPALWPDGYAVMDRFSMFLEKNEEASSFLYMNGGAEENENIINSVQYSGKLLEAHTRKKIRWHVELASNETHGTTPLIGYYLALRKLFRRWDKPLKLFAQEGYDAFVGARIELETELGYPVMFEERTLNSIGYSLLSKGDAVKAAIIFKENAQNYPTSANVHYSLADAYEAQGNIYAAYASLNKAVELLDMADEDTATSILARHKKLKATLEETRKGD